ncbi:wHTH domain-containing protein [Streptomyces griseofuscus]|uniref:wHTH domain-containing protein n=1 Tax=Streptomyces griseofuscus TaxID=146922 RepID=UPI00155A7724|nr:caspase family protein [Streptomyces griseofuscus]
MTATPRSALIIAVPRHDLSTEFEDLSEVVKHDVEGLEAALIESGFNVDVLGAGGNWQATRSSIRSRISEICCTAPADAFVLIHFTGHGVTIDGTDYLVPADVANTWRSGAPAIDTDTLLRLDIADLLRGSTAEAVLFTIDACRDALHDGLGYSGGAATNFPAGNEKTAVIFGCGIGETCGSSRESGSYFTGALTEALSPRTQPRNVREVITFLTRKTRNLARATGRSQNPQAYYPPAGPETISQVVVCEGHNQHQKWMDIVDSDDIWSLCEGAGENRTENLKGSLKQTIEKCSEYYRNTQLQDANPWLDDEYPVRVMQVARRLLTGPTPTSGRGVLSAAELAALAVCPFVREAVLGAAFTECAGLEPSNLEPGTPDNMTNERAALENTWQAHPLVWRKGRELRKRGVFQDAATVSSWLLVRHCLGMEGLWDESFVRSLLRPLASEILEVREQQASRVDDLIDQMIFLARQMNAAPGELNEESAERNQRYWQGDHISLPSGQTEPWRMGEISQILGLAGTLAADIRTFPSVMVDHVGTSDRIEIDQAVRALQDIRWTQSTHDAYLDLDLHCPHQALHAALESLTSWADEAVKRIKLANADHANPRSAIFAHVPRRISCERLRPARDAQTGSIYKLPLLRFQLAESEIRELLMGTQLYGSPTLAIREVYQNALDACRYREARLKYGHQRQSAGDHQWVGMIKFRQGETSDGRRYIECEDNGVGMRAVDLKNTFSRAGRRFEQSRGFRMEQARWRRLDENLRIFPNSRFGIGVFSYFMIADEMVISTRGTDDFGRATDSGLQVHISSSGSLFRITDMPHALPGGGTIVRLYLSEHAAEGTDAISAARTLRSLVWVSEFGLSCTEDGKVTEQWEPGRLYYQGRSAFAPQSGVENFWWVNGRGALLSDGIWVESQNQDREQLFGFVADLKAEHRPALSANRNSLLSIDTAWITDMMERSTDALTGWDKASLNWLWRFCDSGHNMTRELVERFLAVNHSCTYIGDLGHTVEVAIREIGIARIDKHVSGKASRGPNGVGAWRLRLLRDHGIPLARRYEIEPDSIIGYPTLGCWAASVPYADRIGEQSILFVQASISEAAAQNLSLGEALRRLRPLAICGIRVPSPAHLQSSYDYYPDRLDAQLLPDFLGLNLRQPRHREMALRGIGRKSHNGLLDLPRLIERFNRYEQLGLVSGLTAVITSGIDSLSPLDILALGLIDRKSGSEDPAAGSISIREISEALAKWPWEASLHMRSRLGLQYINGIHADTLLVLSENFDRQSPWITGEVSLQDLVSAAGHLHTTVEDVVSKIEPYADLLRVKLPDISEVADLVFHPLDAAILSSDRDIDSLRLPQLIKPVRNAPHEAEFVAQRLEILAGLGFVDGRAPSMVDRWRAGARDAAQAFFNASASELSLTTDTPEQREIFELIVSSRGFQSLERAREAIRVFLGDEFTTAQSAKGAPTFHYHDFMGDAKLDCMLEYWRWAKSGAEGCPPLGHLVAAARYDGVTDFSHLVKSLASRDFIGRRNVIRGEGVAWETHRPDGCDTIIFNEYQAASVTVDYFRLVAIAARFGWTLAGAWSRLAVYIPLGLITDVEEVQEELVPTWFDLVILSSDFCGRKRPLQGRVTMEHVEAAAHEVEMDVPFVLERLQLYSRIFSKFTVSTREARSDANHA